MHRYGLMLPGQRPFCHFCLTCPSRESKSFFRFLLWPNQHDKPTISIVASRCDKTQLVSAVICPQSRDFVYNLTAGKQRKALRVRPHMAMVIIPNACLALEYRGQTRGLYFLLTPSVIYKKNT